MNPYYADSHAHLHDSKFDADRESLIRSLNEKAVRFTVIVAEDLKTSHEVLSLSQKFPDLLLPALGCHPHHAGEWKEEQQPEFENLISRPEVVAVGEIGLDYHYDFSPKENQKKVFRIFLELAKKLHKPVIIHNRKSDEDLLSVLSETASSYQGVIHCFDSTVESAKAFLDMGFMISFSGLVTFDKTGKLREAVEYVPLDRLLIETDSPYLAPHPFRGKRNEPSYVIKVAEKIAEIKKCSLETVAEKTLFNTLSLFNSLERFQGIPPLT